MILGVLVRDVDSGNAERDPIDDPTGWRAMGAAGTRPSENPLIPIRSDSTATDTSIDRTTTNINSGSNSNAHLEAEEGNMTVSDQTPRPNRYTFEERGEETVLVEGKWSMEPESLIMDSGGNSKESMNTLRQTYPLGSHQPEEQSRPPPPSLQNTYITQPPKPTQPPSITANMIPKFCSSPSSQPLPRRTNGRQSSSSLSTPDSSTTASSLNNTINYGGPNGGKMTEVEKRRYELQMRVYRARTQMPSHIVLRVFREPSECVEVEEMILKQAGSS